MTSITWIRPEPHPFSAGEIARRAGKVHRDQRVPRIVELARKRDIRTAIVGGVPLPDGCGPTGRAA